MWRFAVEHGQAVGVLGEMRRNPVQDHADARLVQPVHQIQEIVPAAIARGRRIVTGHLVAPGAVKGILRDPHQLHMSVAHLQDVIREQVRQFPVGVEVAVRFAHKAARMHLQNGDRRRERLKVLSGTDPCPVTPLIGPEPRYNGSRLRAVLRLECERVRLVERLALLCDNMKLVTLSRGGPGDKAFVDVPGSTGLHGVGAGIPVVKAADHTDRDGVRCPYGKIGALLSVPDFGMGSKLFVDLVMRAVAEKIAVQICKGECVLHNKEILPYEEHDCNLLSLSY